jgi:hypothetical protein
MWKVLVLAAAMVVAISAGCDRDDPDAGQGVVTNERTAPVFALPAQEISATIETSRAIGTNVATGLNAPDREQYVAQFHPRARVIDPIVPSLKPSIGEFFSSFGAAGLLCERWPVDAAYVNAGGVLTVGSCDGLYRDLPDAGQLPTGPRVVRHLPISDGRATGLMHRIGLEAASTFARETVVAIGFFDRERVVADLVAEAVTAEDFIDRFESAWETTDPDALGRLYDDRATRHDGYAADKQARQEIVAWYRLLFDAHPDLTLVVSEGFASGLGPAATYELTMDGGGAACVMRIGSVWDLDDEGLILDEYVYYDPETVLACGWAQ